MNIASVPCRCGHSCPASPRAMSGHLREQRRHRQHLDVVARGGARRPRRRSRRCAASRSRRRPRRPGAPRPARCPAAPSAARPAARRRPASGASAPPDGGAARPARCTARRAAPGRTSPAAHGGSRAVGDEHLDVGLAGAAPGARARRGAAPGRRRSAARRRGGRRPAARPCRPGRRTCPARRRRGRPAARGCSSRAASWLPSSCTAAAPERTDGQPPGVAAVQPDGERRPRPRLAAGLLGQRVAVDPPGDQVHLGRGVVGQQRGLQLGVAAQGVAARPRRSSAGGRWPAPAARRRSPPSVSSHAPGRRPAATLRSTALTSPEAPAPTMARVRSTVVSTAACEGTRRSISW